MPAAAAHVAARLMRWVVLLPVVVAAAGCLVAASVPAACRTVDLGALSLCVPPHWVLVRGGIDSLAGHFSADGVRLDYDYGLATSLLPVPAGAAAVAEQAVTVDGRAARQVAYVLPGHGLAQPHRLGVVVPQVQPSAMGPLRLSVLATAADAAGLLPVAGVIASIRFKAVAGR